MMTADADADAGAGDLSSMTIHRSPSGKCWTWQCRRCSSRQLSPSRSKLSVVASYERHLDRCGRTIPEGIPSDHYDYRGPSLSTIRVRNAPGGWQWKCKRCGERGTWLPSRAAAEADAAAHLDKDGGCSGRERE